MQYQNFNNIRHDDFSKIVGVKRIKSGFLEFNGIQCDMYIIKFSYNDGTNRVIRVFCEPGTSQMLMDEGKKKEFFINRLFGENGLIVKERRNDYLYLGGLSNDGRRITRFKQSINGKTMQEEFDEYLKEEIIPNLTFKNNPSNYDPIDMSYHFHCGNEDMDDIFKNGLLSRFGTSFTSTFYPVEWNIYSTINNLEDAARLYGRITSGKGRKVFVTRIPSVYRGEINDIGMHYPPLPTLKMLDSSNGECIIIPEIIYGMYDMENDTFYRNPNYKPKFNPNGLTYDRETVRVFKNSGLPEAQNIANFMESREPYNYDQLKKYDDKNGTFDQYCQYYGISEFSTFKNNDRNARKEGVLSRLTQMLGITGYENNGRKRKK